MTTGTLGCPRPMKPKGGRQEIGRLNNLVPEIQNRSTQFMVGNVISKIFAQIASDGAMEPCVLKILPFSTTKGASGGINKSQLKCKLLTSELSGKNDLERRAQIDMEFPIDPFDEMCIREFVTSHAGSLRGNIPCSCRSSQVKPKRPNKLPRFRGQAKGGSAISPNLTASPSLMKTSISKFGSQY